MSPFPLSSFQRSYVTLELRFDEAYALWDKAGALWGAMRRHFKTMKSAQVTPNQTTFNADGRFALVVSLDRAIITDHKPSGGASSTIDAMSNFVGTVFEHLRVPVLNRVGTRTAFVMKCKSPDEGRQKLAQMLPLNFGGATLFNIKPERISPHLKIDVSDGELGYTAQVYVSERKYDFEPPAEIVAAISLEPVHQTISELTFDVDIFTVEPMPTESFDVRTWLSGCNKSIARDADKLMEVMKGSHE